MSIFSRIIFVVLIIYSYYTLRSFFFFLILIFVCLLLTLSCSRSYYFSFPNLLRAYTVVLSLCINCMLIVVFRLQTSDVRSKSHSLKLFDKRLDCMECDCTDTSDDVCVAKALVTNDKIELKNTSTEKLVSSSYDSDEESDEPYENEVYADTRLAREETKKRAEANSLVASDSFCNFQTPKIVRESLANHKSSVHCKLSTPVISNFPGTLTSTPAPVSLSNDVRTPSPFCGSNEDVSPITMSAQKMPKSMQV